MVYSLNGSDRIVGKHQRWKAAIWSPIRQDAETAEGEGELSQFAENESHSAGFRHC